MKKVILIFSIATILTSTDSWAYKNECVKTNSGSKYYVRCYDSNGNQTSWKSYKGDPDNGVSAYNTEIYTYDSNGNMTSYKSYKGDPDLGASVDYADIYTYDANGNLSYINYSFNSDGSGTISNYICNDKSCSQTSTKTFTAAQYASILADFPTNYSPPDNSAPKPKRTYYTLEEAMGHLSHDNNNKVTFTFK